MSKVPQCKAGLDFDLQSVKIKNKSEYELKLKTENLRHECMGREAKYLQSTFLVI